MKEKLLELKNLKTYFISGPAGKRITVKAVDDVSFDIFKGEVFGLVGESGCGKTTTGRTIIKLHDPTDGEIIYKGKRIGGGIQKQKEEIRAYKEKTKEKIKKAKKAEDKEKIQSLKDDYKAFKNDKKDEIKAIKKDNAFKGETKDIMKEIQMIFQDPIASLNPRMTVREIIGEGLIIEGGYTKKEINEKVFDILEVVGLVKEHAYRYPHEFSGGQRQRIGIARALIVEPELLIADEPISALDVSIQAQVINLLRKLKKRLDLTIMFIAHDLSIVKYFSDRIAVMYYGKLVELADAETVFKHPLHPYTKSLFSAIPRPDPRFEKERVRFDYHPEKEHNYTPEDPPTFREVEKGHWVYASDAEVQTLKQEIIDIDDKIEKDSKRSKKNKSK